MSVLAREERNQILVQFNLAILGMVLLHLLCRLLLFADEVGGDHSTEVCQTTVLRGSVKAEDIQWCDVIRRSNSQNLIMWNAIP